MVVVAAVASQPSSSRAGGVVSNCNETSLDTALATGGLVTFGCSGTITLTSTKGVGAGVSVTIDGAGQDLSLSGGGTVRLFSVQSGGTLHLRNLRIVAGSAPFGAAVVNNGTLSATAVTFTSNTGIGAGNSGAIFNSAGASAAFDASNFTGNSADRAAAIYNLGTIKIEGSTFRNNTATTYDGGAIHSAGTQQAPASVSIAGSLFEANSAEIGGGAIASDGGTATIRSSTFHRNSAGVGGAISNHPFGKMSVINSTFVDNSAQLFGGALANVGVLALVNSTVTGSSPNAVRAGQLGAAGQVTLTNTILAHSVSTNSGPAFDCVRTAPGALVDGGGNLVQDASCGISTGGGPGLGPLQDNGGPTQTMAITRGSPAFGAGVSSACAAPLPNGAGGFDQRGSPRTTCSSGAFEPAALPLRSFLVGLSRDGP